MISIVTIILFFTYTWGLGFTATYWLKKSENAGERHVMNIGLGLGIFAVLSVLLNLLRIPLDWKIFLVLSIIIPLYELYKKRKQLKAPELKVTKSTLTLLIAVMISMGSFYIYTTGAFKYPYLENEDPWGHSEGVKYVAIEKTALEPSLVNPETGKPLSGQFLLSYVDPYPPAYDVFLGILHQTSPDITWTMKFFNALIISLGFLFFYIVAKDLTGDRNRALFATFVLAVIPSYLSHFIWAHAFAVTLFFPLIYAFMRIQTDKRWWVVASIILASVWFSQNLEQPIKITMLIVIYIIVRSIANRRFLKDEWKALVAGIALSFLWWITVLQKYGILGFIRTFYPSIVTEAGIKPSTGATQGFFSILLGKVITILHGITDPGGSASRAYTFKDFFVAQHTNQINSPKGIGIVVSLLTLLSVGYLLLKYKNSIIKEENGWRAIVLFWLIYTFWVVNGVTFPVPIARGAFRSWMLLAIPIALVAAEGLEFLKSLSRSPTVRSGIVAIVILGIVFTSASQKYSLNTAIWPTSSAFSHPQEAFEYGAWAQTLTPNTKVFMYAPRPKIIIGLGMQSCNWCQDELNFRNTILEQDAQSLHRFLKEKEYEYLLINGNMDQRQFTKKFGENKTNEFLPIRYHEIINSGLFVPIYQKEGIFVVLSIV